MKGLRLANEELTITSQIFNVGTLQLLHAKEQIFQEPLNLSWTTLDHLHNRYLDPILFDERLKRKGFNR